MDKPKLYTASWCGGCGTVKKYITDNNIDVELVDLDIDSNRSEALALGIRNIPAMILPDGNKIIGNAIIDHFK